MKNGTKKYTGSASKKTGIGSVPSQPTFPHDDIVLLRSILLTKEFKNPTSHECFLQFYHYVLQYFQSHTALMFKERQPFLLL